MEAVVGEVSAQAAVLVGKQGIEVNPCDALTAGNLLKQDIGIDNNVVTTFEEFPFAHVVIEGQEALQIDFCPGGALLDHNDEAFGHTGDAVGSHIMGNVVDTAHDEQLLGLPLDDGTDAVDHALNDVAHDAPVLDVAVAQQFVELAAVGKAVAQHDDVFLADGQFLKEGCTAGIVRVLVGLSHCGEAHHRHHRQQYPFHCSFVFVLDLLESPDNLEEIVI